MPTASFFDREARLAVHLVSLFQPLPADFIARHADDLSWPGLALNEQLPWSAALVTAHRARLDPQRLANNPSPAARAAMLAALGPSAPPPPCPAPAPAAATIGDVLWPWAHDCTLAPDRPLASLTLDEAVANLRHLAWARLCESPSSPWTPAWSRTLAPRFEEPHPNVSNVALSALRRVHDDECAPALGAAPLAFLAAFFAREPRYMCCSVAISDAHGVLPTVEVDPRAFERGARRVAAAVTRFAQGPRRPVPLGPVQPLSTGACVVLDRAWQAIFSACALPTHTFHELAVPPSKQLAGEPVVLRFAEVFAEGATLPAAHDCLIVRRAAKEPTFFPDQLVLSPRLVAQLRACGAPNLTFTPAAVLRLALADGVAAPTAALAAPTPALAAVEPTPEQAFFAAKRARMQAATPTLPASHRPANDALGRAELRLHRRFPAGLAAFLAAHGKRRIGGYRLLSPARMYLLDRHGYELRHPESWGAVAIAENGLGDCIGLLLRKSSDHELGATLHEFLHETGQVRRWSQSLSRTS